MSAEKMSEVCDCLSCQLMRALADVQHWKANHGHLVTRLGVLRQRPDLPVDRLPVIRQIETMQRRYYALQRSYFDENAPQTQINMKMPGDYEEFNKFCDQIAAQYELQDKGRH